MQEREMIFSTACSVCTFPFTQKLKLAEIRAGKCFLEKWADDSAYSMQPTWAWFWFLHCWIGVSELTIERQYDSLTLITNIFTQAI